MKKFIFLKKRIIPFLAAVLVVCASCCSPFKTDVQNGSAAYAAEFNISAVPEYSGKPYAEINNNTPFFKPEEISFISFESYAPLDSLGRCGACIASVGTDLMPTQKRGEIGKIKPSGWHTVRYDDLVDGKYLYNRCHLIGYQLSGENANERNLITGTRYMNTEGMLPFENKVCEYVKKTKNHVMYRSTPVFEGENLLARGVLLEAYSVEDKGKGIKFCVFCHNVQPGIEIDYLTGESQISGVAETKNEEKSETTFIINKNTKKFHLPDCKNIKAAKEKNKKSTSQTAAELKKSGYSPCRICNPK